MYDSCNYIPSTAINLGVMQLSAGYNCKSFTKKKYTYLGLFFFVNLIIDNIYCLQNILEPIFEGKILALYKKDVDKIEVHMNNASSHTPK